MHAPHGGDRNAHGPTDADTQINGAFSDIMTRQVIGELRVQF